MRWQQLFEDLAAQQEALERQERDAEIAEHTRAERGRVELADRLAASRGHALRIRVVGLGWLTGQVEEAALDWLLLRSGPDSRGELVVPHAAVVAVEGLTGRADQRPRRLGLRHALRALSRDRARVRIHLTDGDQVGGTIDRVLADHVDLSRHPEDEPRRVGAVRGTVTLPCAALAAVRRQ